MISCELCIIGMLLLETSFLANCLLLLIWTLGINFVQTISRVVSFQVFSNFLLRSHLSMSFRSSKWNLFRRLLLSLIGLYKLHHLILFLYVKSRDSTVGWGIWRTDYFCKIFCTTIRLWIEVELCFASLVIWVRQVLLSSLLRKLLLVCGMSMTIHRVLGRLISSCAFSSFLFSAWLITRTCTLIRLITALAR